MPGRRAIASFVIRDGAGNSVTILADRVVLSGPASDAEAIRASASQVRDHAIRALVGARERDVGGEG